MKDILAKLAALEAAGVAEPTKTAKKVTQPLPQGKKKLTENAQDPIPAEGNDDPYDPYDPSALVVCESEYDDDEDDSGLYPGCYVRDEQNDGPNGEVFRMFGGPEERRVRIADKDGRGWNISPSRLTLVSDDDPAISRWFPSDDDSDLDEAVNHMGEREYQTWNGWKSACRKAYPGCGFRGDRDIGAATLDGRDVGEWDGDVGSVYNKPAGPDVAEMTEDEQIDEISGATLGSYVQKARQDAKARTDHGKELDADPKVVADKGKINDWFNSRQYTKSGASIHRSKIDAAHDRIESRKKKLDPNYPASASPSKRRRGIEKAISKMQYGNLTDSVNNVSEAKAPSLSSKIRNSVMADQISRSKDGNYIFRKGYFYTNGMNADKWAARVAAELAQAGLHAELIDSYDHWAAFRGGASTKASSHFAAIFKITDQATPAIEESEDDEPRLAFGQRDGELDSEMRHGDKYFAYRAKGGKLSYHDWEFGMRDWELEESEELSAEYSYRDEDDGSYLTNEDGRTLFIPGVSLADQGFEQGDPALYDVWQSNTETEMADETGAYMVESTRKPVTEVSQDTLSSYKNKAVKASNVANLKGDRATAVKRNKGITNARNRLPKEEPKTYGDDSIQKDYYSDKPGRSYTGDSVNRDSSKKIAEAKADPTGTWIAYKSPTEYKSFKTREGAKQKAASGQGWKIASSEHFYEKIKKSTYEGAVMKKQCAVILEGVKFRVSDPKVAKILRRFPHEALAADAGGELDDRLYDALYDHYCANGEMPYGTMKARDGDPYNWISDKLQTELQSHHANESLEEGTSNMDPEIEEIFDKYPHEAKMFKETGELDDGPLYEELFDHYCNNGEMPYGIAKARDGDPVQWISDRVSAYASTEGDDDDDSYLDFDDRFFADENDPDELDEDLTPAQRERMAKMKADDAKFAAIKQRVEAPNPFSNNGGVSQRAAQHGHTSDLRYSIGEDDESEFGEDSVDPTPPPGEEVIVEVANESEITAKLQDIGLDDGLDFFFDGDDLIVIGRSTARVAINAIGGYIQSIDGEEVRIGTKPRPKAPVADRRELDDLAREPEMQESAGGDMDNRRVQQVSQAQAVFNKLSTGRENQMSYDEIYDMMSGKGFPDFVIRAIATDNESFNESANVTESVNLNIVADGEEDVMAVLRRLSGMNPTPSVTAQPVGIPSMVAAIDAIQGDEYDSPTDDYDDEDALDSVISPPGDEEEVDECEYANEPDPKVQTGLAKTIANAGNEPGRRAYTVGNVVEESKKIARQYGSNLKG